MALSRLDPATSFDLIFGREERYVETGLAALDQMIGGFPPGLTAICSPPSMGTTAFALDIALNAARRGVPVACFALEESRRLFLCRLVYKTTGFPGGQILVRGHLEEAQEAPVRDAFRGLAALPLYLETSPFRSVPEIRTALGLSRSEPSSSSSTR